MSAARAQVTRNERRDGTARTPAPAAAAASGGYDDEPF